MSLVSYHSATCFVSSICLWSLTTGWWILAYGVNHWIRLKTWCISNWCFTHAYDLRSLSVSILTSTLPLQDENACTRCVCAEHGWLLLYWSGVKMLSSRHNEPFQYYVLKVCAHRMKWNEAGLEFNTCGLQLCPYLKQFLCDIMPHHSWCTSQVSPLDSSQTFSLRMCHLVKVGRHGPSD